MVIKRVIRSDDYRHSRRKTFPPEARQKINRKNELLNSDGTDQDKSFGRKTKYRPVNIGLKPFIVF